MVKITLTMPQARGLEIFAEDGHEGIMTDTKSADDYLGSPASQRAACRALQKLSEAIRKAEPAELQPAPGWQDPPLSVSEIQAAYADFDACGWIGTKTAGRIFATLDALLRERGEKRRVAG